MLRNSSTPVSRKLFFMFAIITLFIFLNVYDLCLVPFTGNKFGAILRQQSQQQSSPQRAQAHMSLPSGDMRYRYCPHGHIYHLYSLLGRPSLRTVTFFTSLCTYPYQAPRVLTTNQLYNKCIGIQEFLERVLAQFLATYRPLQLK